jgi:adenylate kinase family enzyme
MPSIVLIGPSKAGKSTVTRLLSEQTGLPWRSTHQINFDEYTEQGFDSNKSEQIWTEQGEQAHYQYLIPFYIYAVKQLLSQPGEAIIDLESEYVAFEDPALLNQVKEALQTFATVILLMPSPVLEESVRILRNREAANLDENFKINDFFIEQPSNQTLAKHTFYTKGKTPEQTSEEILARLDLSKPEPVVLIGPMFTGKSILGLLLSRKLNREQCPLDILRWDYYKEIGYDDEAARKIYLQDGFFGMFLYWQPYHAHAVERVLTEYPNGIIDFGAGHSVYPDLSLLTRVQKTLAPYSNVILILPSPDPAESMEILRKRFLDLMSRYYDLHEGFTRSGAFEKVAKQTIYTEGKTPEQVATEIIRLAAAD